MIMWWCLRLKGKTVMMGFSLRVTCRKGTMAPNIWLLIMGPLAKCEIPTLSEWIRNKQEPPKGKVNLRRQVSRGGSADSPDQEIRKPGAESQIGVRTGWRLSQRTGRWYEGPSGQSSLKGSKSQTHEMLLSICFLYPLQTTKTWGENVVKSYIRYCSIFFFCINLLKLSDLTFLFWK